MKKKLLLILSLVFSLSLSACGNNEENTSEDTSQTEETGNEDKSSEAGSEETKEGPKAEAGYKDTINMAITAQPPNLDPPTSSSNVALAISMHFFEPLFAMDENYQPQPMLAESYEVNDDFTVYTIKLREGIKFHDGKEMVAEDVAASMNYWLETSERARNILGQGNFEVVDDYTVKATFDKPARDFITLAASRANFPAIRTSEAIASAGAEGVTDYNGTGPFKFQEWKQDQYIHLVKNENYKPREEAASGYAGKKEALVDNIYFRIVSDTSTRTAGMISGEYDITDEVPTDAYEQLSSDENLEVLTSPGGTLTLFLNTKEGPLADVNMRKAIFTAINAEDALLSAYSYEDLYSLDPGFMNPNMPQWKTDQGSDVYNLANPEEAKKLAEEAGYNGEVIRILTTPDYDEMYKSSIVLQEQLRQAGFQAELEEYDFPTFMEKRSDLSNWDLFITSNAYQVLPQQLSALTPEWAGADDEKLMDLKDQIINAENQDQASETWDQIQDYIYHDYLAAYAIGQYNTSVCINKKVEGFNMFESALLWNVRVAE